MKKLLVVVMMSVAGVATALAQTATAPDAKSDSSAQTSKKAKKSLAEARAMIDKVIENPQLMVEIMGQLSAEDQIAFIADVNEAIGKMPDSLEAKTAKYLNVNNAAVRSAAEGNLKAVLAEVFATVPPESLTVISERFAIDLFDRDGTKYSEKEFAQIAKDTMAVINARTEDTENGSTRSTFAMLMFIRAAHAEHQDELIDLLVDTLQHDDAKELAKNEWIPAALGKKDENGKVIDVNYEPLLASADAGRRPDIDFVLVIAGPQFGMSVTSDLVGKNNDQMAFMRNRTPILDAVENPLNKRIPVLGGDIPGMAGETGWSNPKEPKPYRWQSTLGGR